MGCCEVFLRTTRTPKQSKEHLSRSWTAVGKENESFVPGSRGGGFRFFMGALKAPRWEVGTAPSLRLAASESTGPGVEVSACLRGPLLTWACTWCAFLLPSTSAPPCPPPPPRAPGSAGIGRPRRPAFLSYVRAPGLFLPRCDSRRVVCISHSVFSKLQLK